MSALTTTERLNLAAGRDADADWPWLYGRAETVAASIRRLAASEAVCHEAGIGPRDRLPDLTESETADLAERAVARLTR